MKIIIKLLFIILISIIYSCYENNRKSEKIQSMNSDEDTISTTGFILYYDNDVKYSFFVPVEDSIIENNILKIQYFQTQHLGMGFQFFPAEDDIWETINLNKERILVKKNDIETNQLISDTLNILLVRAKVERKLRNLRPERIYEDNFKVTLDDKIVNFKYTKSMFKNLILFFNNSVQNNLNLC